MCIDKTLLKLVDIEPYFHVSGFVVVIFIAAIWTRRQQEAAGLLVAAI